MKMPEKIKTELFAPCGVNCISCEKYNNPCSGCLTGDLGKNKSTLKCKIKACFDNKKFKYCGRCSEFPCKLLKKHDKNFKKRHDISTLESASRIKYMGINKMMVEDREKWNCPNCGGIISYQKKTCSECNFEKSFK